MNGVEILHEYAVCTTQTWVSWIVILAFIGGIIFFIGMHHSETNTAGLINGIGFIICFITFLALGMIDDTNYLKEYSYTEYKVTIDDSVSMNEFLDKYEILDQEGKIYIVKERE